MILGWFILPRILRLSVSGEFNFTRLCESDRQFSIFH